MTTDRPAPFAAMRRLAARAARSPRVLPSVGERHIEFSLIAPPTPSPNDSSLVTTLIDAATRILTGEVREAMADSEPRLATDDQRRWWRTWPGEHYRLLTALTAHLGAERVVEVGTFTGMGSLAMLAGGAGHVTTYDVIRWDQFQDTALRVEDLDGRVTQRLVDLSSRDVFSGELETLAAADLVFVDGPKDWVFEPAFFALLEANRGALQRPLFVVDDVRTIPLARTWLGMDWSAVDATSLGHWSGTGLARFP